MKLQFIKEYAFAHQGIRIERFLPGQVVADPSDELLRMALADGVAIDPDEQIEVEPEEQPPEPELLCKPTKRRTK